MVHCSYLSNAYSTQHVEEDEGALRVVLISLHLSNAHSTQHVEEDEGALSVVLPRQVPVAHPLQEGDGREGEVRHHSPFEAARRDDHCYCKKYKLLFLKWKKFKNR